jgi:hypothetical protein
MPPADRRPFVRMWKKHVYILSHTASTAGAWQQHTHAHSTGRRDDAGTETARRWELAIRERVYVSETERA